MHFIEHDDFYVRNVVGFSQKTFYVKLANFSDWKKRISITVKCHSEKTVFIPLGIRLNKGYKNLEIFGKKNANYIKLTVL